jgi:hypothetical protein
VFRLFSRQDSPARSRRAYRQLSQARSLPRSHPCNLPSLLQRSPALGRLLSPQVSRPRNPRASPAHSRRVSPQPFPARSLRCSRALNPQLYRRLNPVPVPLLSRQRFRLFNHRASRALGRRAHQLLFRVCNLPCNPRRSPLLYLHCSQVHGRPLSHPGRRRRNRRASPAHSRRLPLRPHQPRSLQCDQALNLLPCRRYSRAPYRRLSPQGFPLFNHRTSPVRSRPAHPLLSPVRSLLYSQALNPRLCLPRSPVLGRPLNQQGYRLFSRRASPANIPQISRQRLQASNRQDGPQCSPPPFPLHSLVAGRRHSRL